MPETGANAGKAVYNPWAWNSNATVIWLDQPAGVGFSYGSETDKDEADVAVDAYAFLQAFFKAHPLLQPLPFFVFGESYGGHYTPAISYAVAQGNAALAPGDVKIALTGVGIGNGLTVPADQYPKYAELAYNYSITKLGHPVITLATYEQMVRELDVCIPLIESCQTDTSSCALAQSVCNNAQIGPYEATNLNPYDVRLAGTALFLLSCGRRAASISQSPLSSFSDPVPVRVSPAVLRREPRALQGWMAYARGRTFVLCYALLAFVRSPPIPLLPGHIVLQQRRHSKGPRRGAAVGCLQLPGQWAIFIGLDEAVRNSLYSGTARRWNARSHLRWRWVAGGQLPLNLLLPPHHSLPSRPQMSISSATGWATKTGLSIWSGVGKLRSTPHPFLLGPLAACKRVRCARRAALLSPAFSTRDIWSRQISLRQRSTCLTRWCMAAASENTGCTTDCAEHDVSQGLGGLRTGPSGYAAAADG